MAGFTYRLEPLLKLRYTARDERRAALAEVREAGRVLRQQIKHVENQLIEVSNRLRGASKPGAINVDELLGGHRHNLMLNAQKLQLESNENRLNGEIERRRELLVESDKQVRMLEKLRERHQEAYVAVEIKREVKAMDEFAIQCLRPKVN